MSDTPTTDIPKTAEPKYSTTTEYRRAYYQANREKIKAENTIRKQYKYHNDPEFREKCKAYASARNKGFKLTEITPEAIEAKQTKSNEAKNEMKELLAERFTIKSRQNKELEELKETHRKELEEFDEKIKLWKLNSKNGAE